MFMFSMYLVYIYRGMTLLVVVAELGGCTWPGTSPSTATLDRYNCHPPQHCDLIWHSELALRVLGDYEDF